MSDVMWQVGHVYYIHYHGQDGVTVLMLAAGTDLTDILQSLLAAGADMNIQDWVSTPVRGCGPPTHLQTRAAV